MPRFSLFSPMGHLRLTSEPPLARRIYDSKVANLGGDGLNFAIREGTYVDARLFAESMMRAHARMKLQRAGDQDKPTRVYEALPEREEEYGLVPLVTDTIHERKAALAARMRLPGGSGLANMLVTLRTLLGDAFRGIRVTADDERVVWPAALGDQPMNLQLPEARKGVVRLLDAVSTGLGSPALMPYEDVETSTPPIYVGDKLVVEPEVFGRTEVVEVEALGSAFGFKFFQATFEQAHEPECLGVLQPWPMWTSNQREVLVVLEAEAALDAETRRKLELLLQVMVSGVGTWGIVQETDEGEAGPFLVGESPLGATPLGTMEFVVPVFP